MRKLAYCDSIVIKYQFQKTIFNNEFVSFHACIEWGMKLSRHYDYRLYSETWYKHLSLFQEITGIRADLRPPPLSSDQRDEIDRVVASIEEDNRLGLSVFLCSIVNFQCSPNHCLIYYP